MNTIEDIYRYIVGAYYGIRELDEYDLKEFILKDIENYIKEFIKENPLSNFDYQKEAEIIEQTLPLKTKLQDSLLVLPKVNASIELILLVKKRIKSLDDENYL